MSHLNKAFCIGICAIFTTCPLSLFASQRTITLNSTKKGHGNIKRPHMPAFVPYSCWMDDEYIYVESLGECGYATVTIETADGTVIATDIIDDTDPATPTVTLPAPIIPGDYTITITTESGAIYSGEFFYN